MASIFGNDALSLVRSLQAAARRYNGFALVSERDVVEIEEELTRALDDNAQLRADLEEADRYISFLLNVAGESQ